MTTVSAVNLSLIIATMTIVLTLIVRIEVRERRISRIEDDVKYLRRDVAQIMALYRLTPVEEQEKRRRR